MAALVTVRLPAALPPIERDFLRAGAPGARGRSLAVTSRYLELDGRPWLPVMGEFHYSRYPADEWEVELRKMRAGGISTTSPNKELANEFLENYLLSKDGLHAMNAHVPLGVPANKALFDELKSDPLIAGTMAAARSGSLMPNNPEMARFWTVMLAALQNITQGRETAKAGLDRAVKRIKGAE